MMTDLGIDGEAADHIEQLLETVKGIVSDPGVSAEEAFYASLLMEFSEMEDLYEKMITGLAQDHRAMYDTVRARLDNHHATFAEAAARFCNDRGLAAAFENLVSKK
jgi:hypothetical protein